MNIQRYHTQQKVTIANGEALSEEFYLAPYTFLLVHMPAAWTAASVGFKVAQEEDGTYQPLYDEAGNLVQIASPAVDKVYSAPAEVAGGLFVKLWSQDGAGANTNQGAERKLGLSMKG